jgi:hypothetical protein
MITDATATAATAAMTMTAPTRRAIANKAFISASACQKLAEHQRGAGGTKDDAGSHLRFSQSAARHRFREAG